MQVSILVVSYNARDTLRRCLSSLPRDADVIVVDNASPDDSADMVRHEFPCIRLIASPKNRGFSWAVNEAAKQARGQAFLLLNPDTEILPGTWERLPALLINHPTAAAVGFRQVDDTGRFQLSFGFTPSFRNELLRRSVQRTLDQGGPLMAKFVDTLFSTARPVGWVSGSSLLVRRTAFQRIGGFDDKFFLYFEDIDFCLRLRQDGGHIFYDPRVTILHHRGVSAATAPVLSQQAYRQSQLLFWQKHHGAWARRAVATYLRYKGLSPT